MTRLRDVALGCAFFLVALGMFAAWGNEDRRALAASRRLMAGDARPDSVVQMIRLYKRYQDGMITPADTVLYTENHGGAHRAP